MVEQRSPKPLAGVRFPHRLRLKINTPFWVYLFLTGELGIEIPSLSYRKITFIYVIVFDTTLWYFNWGTS